MNISLSRFAPENLVSRDGLGSPVPRQPAYLAHTQAKSGAYLLDFCRFPLCSTGTSTSFFKATKRNITRTKHQRESREKSSLTGTLGLHSIRNRELKYHGGSAKCAHLCRTPPPNFSSATLGNKPLEPISRLLCVGAGVNLWPGEPASCFPALGTLLL